MQMNDDVTDEILDFIKKTHRRYRYEKKKKLITELYIMRLRKISNQWHTKGGLGRNRCVCLTKTFIMHLIY